ncbi:YceI family protein [Pseudonocardia benzenivorans]|uniref:YceI family protein n=1 Tax=Pseudonocardia benzenivorans TaxID=228005 RepID=A0ABW3VQQ4_9PSEU
MTARPAPTVHDGSGVRGVAPGRHRIAPTRSTLAFRVREFGMVTVTGTFAVLDGEAVVTDGVARVRVVADAGSFTTGNRRRDADVRGHRFLDAATFPELTWTGELADGTTTAPGTLRVRDVETPTAVEVAAVESGRGVTGVRARMVVDRCAAGVPAGRLIVARTLDVDADLTLLRVA